MDSSSQSTQGLIHVGTSSYAEAKRIQGEMASRGVKVMLASEPDTCSSKSCQPKIEIFVEEKHLPVVQAFFKSEHDRAFGNAQLDPHLLNEVFDPEKATARCPACGEEFSTQLTECPGCGLGFGA